MQLFANNADSSLNGAIASNTLVITLKTGEGAKFPSPSNGDYFLVTLYQKLGSDEINHEIVKCTSRAGDTLTVVRAQEGTTAKAFNDGDLVELRITKGTVENFAQPENLATKEPVIAAPSSAPTEKYWRGDKTWRDFFTDVRAATLTGLSTATNAAVTATDTVLAAIGKLQAQVSAKFDKTGGDVDGNINFTGTARRITGDFSNAMLADRTLFQTSIANGATGLQVVPNGTGTQTQYVLHTDSAVTNGPFGDVTVSKSLFRLRTGVIGTGNPVPMTFDVNGSERLRIDAGGNISVQSGILFCGNGQTGSYPPVAIVINPTTHATSKRALIALGSWIIGQDSNASGARDLFFLDGAAGQRLKISTTGDVLVTGGALGYGVGAGGTVVQATSKSTAVTLNKPSGCITTSSSALAAGATVVFLFKNSSIGADGSEVLSFTVAGYAADIYTVVASFFAPGVCSVSIKNNTAASLSEAVPINFAIIKTARS